MSETMGFCTHRPTALPHAHRSRHPTAIAVLQFLLRHRPRRRGPCHPPYSCYQRRCRFLVVHATDAVRAAATPAVIKSAHRLRSHPPYITFYPVPHLSPTSTFALCFRPCPDPLRSSPTPAGESRGISVASRVPSWAPGKPPTPHAASAAAHSCTGRTGRTGRTGQLVAADHVDGASQWLEQRQCSIDMATRGGHRGTRAAGEPLPPGGSRGTPPKTAMAPRYAGNSFSLATDYPDRYIQ